MMDLETIKQISESTKEGKSPEEIRRNLEGWETRICVNSRCKKEFEVKIKNVKKKYCSELCRTRQNARDYHNKFKDDPEYKRKQREFLKQWYPKNRKRQNKNCLLDYYRNKDKWAERAWLDNHRKTFLEVLKNCETCGKPEVNFIRFIEFGKRPSLKSGFGKDTKKRNRILPIKFAKGNLRGYCSKMCSIQHGK